MSGMMAGEQGRLGAGGRRPFRSLHVIDLEWLAAADDVAAIGRDDRAWPPDWLLRRAWAEYVQAVGIQSGDHALLGVRSGRCGRLADLLTTGRAQLRVAPDARGVRAELAESIDIKHAARRFDWLVIAGGCAELAAVAAEGLACGMRVWHVGCTSPAVSAIGAPRIRWTRLLRVQTAA